MKKAFFILLLFCASEFALAQKPIDNSSIRDYKTGKSLPKGASNRLSKKTDTSEWYIPIQYALNIPVIGDSLKSAIGFLQHDSLAKLVYTDGTTANNTWLSVGCILDPKDSAINAALNSGTILNQYASYRLDSIRFTYIYVRNTDSLPDGSGGKLVVTDTLFISYFKGSQIQKYTFDGSQNKYGLVGWRGDSVRMPASAFQTDIVLLTQNDSTGIANTDGKFENFFATKTFSAKAPAGLSVPSNGGKNTDNLIGYAFTFKSGIPTVVGTDTAIMLYQKDPSTLPPGSRRTNYFGFSYAVSDTMRVNQSYFNTSLLAPSLTSYQSYNGWNGYVPGNGFMKEYFIDADFYLTHDDVNTSIHEIVNDNISLNTIFPNPVSSSERPRFSLQLKNTSAITIEIFNLVGQCVKTICTNQHFSAGEHSVEIDLQGLHPGIYMVTIATNGMPASKKLIITN
jgi:hypothetical protein